MNRERLELMATLMDEIAADDKLKPRFSLRAWVGSDLRQVEQEKMSVHFCGTTACAVGFAVLDERFRAQGFSLKWLYMGCVPVYRTSGDYCREFSGWQAIEEFFEIPLGRSLYLFSKIRYPSMDRTGPDQVADRIRAVLKSPGRSR